MKFARFLSGITGIIFLLSLPIVLGLGIMNIIMSSLASLITNIPKIAIIITTIIGMILFFILSVYMIWWGFIDKENPEKNNSKKRNFTEWIKNLKNLNIGDYLYILLGIIFLVGIITLIIILIKR